MGQVLSSILSFLCGGKVVENGSAESPGGMSESLISATAGFALIVEKDPPQPSTAGSLPQKHLSTPHFCSIDIEKYCSCTEDDTSHYQLQEDILSLSSLESSVSGEDDSTSSRTGDVDQHTALVEVVCEVVKEEIDITLVPEVQEDILTLSSLESSVSGKDNSTSSKTGDVDQDTALVEVVCEVVKEEIDITLEPEVQEDILPLSSLESSVSGEDDSTSSRTGDDDQDTVLAEVVCEVAKLKIEITLEPEVWMKQYSSRQKILLVGDGDFSFSACLAKVFGSATNIIATSLNSQGFLISNYGSAMTNIGSLRGRGAKVFHGVDATEMAENFLFQGMRFDRIIFNFPLAGFFPGESTKSQLQRHRKLIRLFMRNAKKMVNAKGEIHISHKSNGFFLEWNLQQLASSEGLQLKQEKRFNFTDYPGYRTKYGFGGDRNFNCNPSKSYIFGLIRNV